MPRQEKPTCAPRRRRAEPRAHQSYRTGCPHSLAAGEHCTTENECDRGALARGQHRAGPCRYKVSPGAQFDCWVKSGPVTTYNRHRRRSPRLMPDLTMKQTFPQLLADVSTILSRETTGSPRRKHPRWNCLSLKHQGPAVERANPICLVCPAFRRLDSMKAPTLFAGMGSANKYPWADPQPANANS
jgi:hypothetical protein